MKIKPKERAKQKESKPKVMTQMLVRLSKSMI